MAKKFKKIGKFLGQMLVTALLASVILSIVSWVVGLIAPYSGVFYSLLTSVIAVVFFVWAMKINPGKEDFLTTIPIVILSIAVIDLIRLVGLTFIPSLAVPFTFVGFAFGLGSVFLATMLTKKYIVR
jgi:hypothetical protein